MSPQKMAIAILTTLSVSLTLADDFKTINGKEYKDATVTRVEPDGIFVKTKTGIAKLYFAELPPEVQKRFNYDPQQAATFIAAEAANYAATQGQQQQQQQLDDGQRQRDKGNNDLAKGGQKDAIINAIAGLEGRLEQIHSEEAMLQEKIHAMERWHLGKLERDDLENLKRQLSALKG